METPFQVSVARPQKSDRKQTPGNNQTK